MIYFPYFSLMIYFLSGKPDLSPIVIGFMSLFNTWNPRFLPKLISFLNLFEAVYYHTLLKDLHLNWFVIIFHSIDLSPVLLKHFSAKLCSECGKAQLQGGEPSTAAMAAQPFWQQAPLCLYALSAGELLWVVRNRITTNSHKDFLGDFGWSC